MKKISIRKVIASSVISLLLMPMFYLAFEPLIANATAVTDTVVVTLNVDSGVTITAPADITMAPNIGTGSNSSISATGATWTVVTNSATGYGLTVQASTTAALKSGSNQFTDASLTPALWSVPASSTQFGFSVRQASTGWVNTTTWGTGADCGSAGTPNATLKYSGFNGVTPINIATFATPTPLAGQATNVCFAAGQNGIFAAAGVYTATITATATAA